MNNLTANLITGILVLLIGFLLHLLYLQDKDFKKETSLKINELIIQRDSTNQLLRQSEEQRLRLNHIADSLNNHVQTLALEVKIKDREIRSIKGRYDKVSQDSLAILMDKRAAR